jgi:hypothetical protein
MENQESMTTYRLLSKEDLESRMLKQPRVTYAVVRTSKHLIEVALFFTIIEGIERYGFYLKLDDEIVAQSVSFEQSKSISLLYDEGIESAKEYLGRLYQEKTLVELLNVSPDEWSFLNEKKEKSQIEFEKHVRDLYYKQNNVGIWQMPIEDSFPKILATVKSVFN